VDEAKSGKARLRRRALRWFMPLEPPDGLRGIPEVLRDLWRAQRRAWSRLAGVVRGLKEVLTTHRRPRMVAGSSMPGVAQAPNPPDRVDPPKLHPLDRVRRWISITVCLLGGVFLVELALEWIDPFGVSRAMKERSQDVLSRLYAPFYGSAANGALAQSRIAVVLIDDVTLREREQSWPPTYSYYAEVSRRVLRQHPTAVFWDVVLDHRRRYDPTFERARKTLDQLVACSGIPMVHAVSTPTNPSLFGPRAVRPEGLPTGAGCDFRFADGSRGRPGRPAISEVLVGWRGYGGAYPLRVSADRALGAGTSEDPVHDTAALWLFRLACSGGGAGCRTAADDPRMRQVLEENHPVFVRWGSNWPAVERPPIDDMCLRTHSPGLWQRVKAAAGLVGDSLFVGHGRGEQSLEDLNRAVCGYTLTLFEDQLADPAVAKLLKNRIVLIGTRLTSANDYVYSPVLRSVPGVYLHAMALDNLMTFGASYVHPPEHELLSKAMVALVLSGMFAAVLMLLPDRPVLRFVVFLLGGLSLTILGFWLLHVFFNEPLPDWIMVLVALLLGARELKEGGERSELHGEQGQHQMP